MCEGRVKSHELLLLTYQSNYPSYPAVPETEPTYIVYGECGFVWQNMFTSRREHKATVRNNCEKHNKPKFAEFASGN